MSNPPAKILVVDDQPETGHLMTRILHHLGHDAIHVPSGPEALQFVKTSTPAVVLLDYMMPGMDGLAVLRALRENPETKHIPVIMFSANNDPMLVQKAMTQGANEYWVKATLAVEEMGIRLNRCLGACGGDC